MSFIYHSRAQSLVIRSKSETKSGNTAVRLFTCLSIKKDFPQLTIVVNGGIKNIDEAKQHLHHLDGVMIGREAYQNPALLTQVDVEFLTKGA